MNASNSPPAAFTPPLQRSPLRDAIGALTRRPEPELLPGLLQAAQLDTAQAEAAQALALRLAQGLRERKTGLGRAGLVQALLQEFALSSQEGVALMCLAEALLRIPDAATRDALIRDKIARGDWRAHLGASPSLFVNAAAWGLLLTGKLVATHSAEGLGAALKRVVGRGGEPLIRRGVDLTMRLMGEQFVIGETIAAALATARRREAQGFRHSYDMLGEAALTDTDARRYLAAYEQAIDAIGAASGGRGVYDGPGISIKSKRAHQPDWFKKSHWCKAQNHFIRVFIRERFSLHYWRYYGLVNGWWPCINIKWCVAFSYCYINKYYGTRLYNMPNTWCVIRYYSCINRC